RLRELPRIRRRRAEEARDRRRRGPELRPDLLPQLHQSRDSSGRIRRRRDPREGRRSRHPRSDRRGAADTAGRRDPPAARAVRAADPVSRWRGAVPRGSWRLPAGRVSDPIVLVDLDRRTLATIRRVVPQSGLGPFFAEIFPLLRGQLAAQGATPAGPPLARYYNGDRARSM